jgi:hypothetical protein
MKNVFKTLETLDKAKMGILYNDQENNHSHDNKENSCCRYQKKMRKIREEMLSAWSAGRSSKDRETRLTCIEYPKM